MPTLDPPESFTLPFKLADQCLAVIGEVSYDERPTAEVQSPGFQSAFASGLEIVLKHLRQILPELEHAITPEIEGAASKVAVEYYRLAGPRQKCALLAVKSGCAFILKARHVVTLPTAPADYAMLGGDLHAVAWPKRKDVEALRDGLAAECKLVARELSSAQGQPALSPLPNAPAGQAGSPPVAGEWIDRQEAMALFAEDGFSAQTWTRYEVDDQSKPAPGYLRRKFRGKKREYRRADLAEFAHLARDRKTLDAKRKGPPQPRRRTPSRTHGV